ncbi:MAG: hypothetical protein IJB71_04305 [Bacilli bacterium]|nr:hypothetical protein [Bacilli bacterium]
MKENYFKFNLYGDNWSDLAETGKYVFQNRDNKVGVHNSLPFLVFHFITDYNLSDLELFFRLAGFSAFTQEEMPDSITIPEVINLSNHKNIHAGWFGGFTNEEEAKKYIETELGAGIISRYREVKRALLAHKKVQLLEQMRSVEQKIEEYTLATTDSSRHTR